MVAEARKAKALSEKGIDKPLELPKNGILVPELVPVAMGGCRILVKRRQISDCNSLSGLNPLTNRILNKKIIM
jgi:APO RNA-binding